jgi:hypothetical protein
MTYQRNQKYFDRLECVSPAAFATRLLLCAESDEISNFELIYKYD